MPDAERLKELAAFNQKVMVAINEADLLSSDLIVSLECLKIQLVLSTLQQADLLD